MLCLFTESVYKSVMILPKWDGENEVLKRSKWIVREGNQVIVYRMLSNTKLHITPSFVGQLYHKKNVWIGKTFKYSVQVGTAALSAASFVFKFIIIIVIGRIRFHNYQIWNKYLYMSRFSCSSSFLSFKYNSIVKYSF